MKLGNANVARQLKEYFYTEHNFIFFYLEGNIRCSCVHRIIAGENLVCIKMSTLANWITPNRCTLSYHGNKPQDITLTLPHNDMICSVHILKYSY